MESLFFICNGSYFYFIRVIDLHPEDDSYHWFAFKLLPQEKYFGYSFLFFTKSNLKIFHLQKKFKKNTDSSHLFNTKWGILREKKQNTDLIFSDKE